LQQQSDILHETLYNRAVTRNGKTVTFATRNTHGNLIPFYDSICAILNDGTSYPSFVSSPAPANPVTVRQFVDKTLPAHRDKLTETFGTDFLDNPLFMKYPLLKLVGATEEEIVADGCQRQMEMSLDALVQQDDEPELQHDSKSKNMGDQTSKGLGAGHFKNTTGVTIDAGGHIVVGDSTNHRGQMLRYSDGGHVRTIDMGKTSGGSVSLAYVLNEMTVISPDE